MFLKLILDPSNYEKKKILLLRLKKLDGGRQTHYRRQIKI